MKLLALISLLANFANAKAADSFKGYVQVDQDHEVYVEYSAPQTGQPTVVLVNGLVYNLHRWDPYVEKLTAQGIGVLRYYFRGQLLTLTREAERTTTPKFMKTGLDYRDLAIELAQLLDAMDIREKINVIGLSYGASIAAQFAETHPEKVDNLILMAPLVVSLDRYNPMGAWIRQSLDSIRFWWGPLWGPKAYEYYYGTIYHSYLVDQGITREQIPPEVAKIPDLYKEAVFHQVRAVRDFDLRKFSFKKVANVHLMLSAEEDAPALADQYQSWQAWETASLGSLVNIRGSSHAIPDSMPVFAASLTQRILRGDRALQRGRIYSGADTALIECENLIALKQNKCGQ